MPVSDYSTTPADNTSISGLTVSDATVADTIDNIIRQLMADIRSDYDAARPVARGGTGATTATGAIGTLGVGVEKISRQVLGSASSVINVTWDNTNFDTIEIHVQNFIPVTDLSRMVARTSADAVTYDNGASDYGWRKVTRQLGSTESLSSTGGTDNIIDMTGDIGNDVNDGGASVVITIHNAGIAKHTKVSWVGTYNTGAGATEARVEGSGRRSIAEVVTGFRLFCSGSSNIQAGAIVTAFGYRK